MVDDTTAHGVRKVVSFDAGDWLAYDPVNLVGITGVEARAIGTARCRSAGAWPTPTPS